MFSWYKYLIVSLVFSHLGFWSGSLFLIAPFPDLCLLVLFFELSKVESNTKTGACNSIDEMVSYFSSTLKQAALFKKLSDISEAKKTQT